MSIRTRASIQKSHNIAIVASLLDYALWLSAMFGSIVLYPTRFEKALTVEFWIILCEVVAQIVTYVAILLPLVYPILFGGVFFKCCRDCLVVFFSHTLRSEQ